MHTCKSSSAFWLCICLSVSLSKKKISSNQVPLAFTDVILNEEQQWKEPTWLVFCTDMPLCDFVDCSFHYKHTYSLALDLQQISTTSFLWEYRVLPCPYGHMCVAVIGASNQVSANKWAPQEQVCGLASQKVVTCSWHQHCCDQL